MTDYIQVFTTVDSREKAEEITKKVVELRLAACAQVIGPMKSTYWWKGRVEEADEWLCLLKSRIDLYSELEKALKELHPYEVPEVIAVPIMAGSEEYLRWLGGELRKKG